MPDRDNHEERMPPQDSDDLIGSPSVEALRVVVHQIELLQERLDALEPDVPSEPNPTRTNVIKTQRTGETIEMEWDSIHSVEITSTVKDGPRVSKVKVYDADPMAAARIAADLLVKAEMELMRAVAVLDGLDPVAVLDGLE